MKIPSRYVPMLATLVTLLVLLSAGGIRYTGFLSSGVLLNLIDDNAFLGIAAIGMTFVILAGGIDLSVGSIVALTSTLIANLVEKHHMSPIFALPLVLAVGTLIGTFSGMIIQFFLLPSFLVTLAAMFLARGIAYVISLESVQLSHPFFEQVAAIKLPLGFGVELGANAIIFLAALALASIVASYTRFGRTTYAIGGSEPSAVLMALPVGRTKIMIYALAGFFSALAGIVYTIYTSSGNSTAAMGLELDAIAAVVIGGTLLTGGTGYLVGTLMGVLILGVIQTAVTFESTLSSWWTRIAVGALVFVFIVMQRFLTRDRRRCSV